jgi:DMSO reductase family type II enzyme chaperone
MSEEMLGDLTNPAAQLAASRSRAYGAFAEAFEYPDQELGELARSGGLARALREVLEAVDPALAEGGDWQALGQTGDEDDLAVEFTRLFDVGASGPPCPLYGGLWVGARMKTMEEVVRFYNHFGLTLSEKPRELPDHLTTQLEFLHFLAYREAEALERGDDPSSYQRAQRDFLGRHPGRWIPMLRAKLEAQEPMPFFLELVRRLERLLEAELARLVALVGPVPAGTPSSSPSSSPPS